MTSLEITRPTVMMALLELKPHPENPKSHDLRQLRSSVEAFGFVEPIVMDERTGYVISGHGRLDLLMERQVTPNAKVPNGIVTDAEGRWHVPVVRGWSSANDEEARAVLVALNQVGVLGGWDAQRLADVLQASSAAGLLALTGFSEADLSKMLQKAASVSEGALLARTDVTLGEPNHAVAVGDCFRLAGRHHLVVSDVMTGWALWQHLLIGDCIFVPYPGVYAPLTKAAEERNMVMVQPDIYVAGHLLDKFVSIHGEVAVEALT